MNMCLDLWYVWQRYLLATIQLRALGWKFAFCVVPQRCLIMYVLLKHIDEHFSDPKNLKCLHENGRPTSKQDPQAHGRTQRSVVFEQLGILESIEVHHSVPLKHPPIFACMWDQSTFYDLVLTPAIHAAMYVDKLRKAWETIHTLGILSSRGGIHAESNSPRDCTYACLSCLRKNCSHKTGIVMCTVCTIMYRRLCVLYGGACCMEFTRRKTQAKDPSATIQA